MKTTLEENIKSFENRLIEGGYPVPIVRQYLSELKFADRKTALQREQQNRAKKTVTFCCTALYLD